MNKYRVVTMNENNRMQAWEMPAGSEPVPVEAFVEQMKARGYEFTGWNDNHRQREELQGAPKFKGIAGPMWDGGYIRYESVAVYAQLSA